MRFLKWLVAVVVLACLAYVVFAWAWGVPSVEERATLTDTESIAQGQYLVTAGDCGSCHSPPGMAAMAGGLPVATPFGTIYSTNITPAKSGIAGMTSAEFYQNLAYGADNILHPLYPAMVYTSYHVVTRDDSDRMHAYFMSLPPVENDPPQTRLGFPFNIRPAMFGWNLLFASRAAFAPDTSKDDVWNRGAYLVQGLGHCGSCHTPRNALGAEENGKWLAGAQLDGMLAPDITATGLRARGWSYDQLVSYLATGSGPRGSAYGEMSLVIDNSLALMTPEDRVAIATYLLDGQTGAPASSTAARTAIAGSALDTTASEGRSLYLGNCALCHKASGGGIPNAVPSISGNATVLQADGRNLVAVTADGLAASQVVPGTGVVALGPMPAFRDRLTAEQITTLSNYVRATFGNGEVGDLTEDEVKAILAGQ